MEVNVCPARLLEEDDGEAIELVQWWLSTTHWEPMSGTPIGSPEWPYQGGELRQPNRLVEAVRLLKAEWSHLERDRPEPKAAPAKKAGS